MASNIRPVPLSGDSFELWPWASLRSAGFPARMVLALSAPESAALIDRLLAEGEDRAPEALQRAFEVESARAGEALRAAARHPGLREAMTWQNRAFVHTGLDSLARKPPGARDKKVRGKEQAVASYLQRYCVKNDSIGFFGPTGWLEVTEGPDAISFAPGAALLASRGVFFESWCIDALIERLNEDPELRPWATPRLLPYFRLDGTRLRVPFMGAVELDPAQARILERCDGSAHARGLAAGLAAEQGAAPAREEEVFEVLERARTMGVIAWGFDVPLELHPERSLREALERVEDEALRRGALARLDELEAALARVAAAAGDAVALDGAMAELEATFERLTGARSTRAAGQTYAARTLVYEDCRRDIEMEVGAPLLEKLAPPLSLLLTAGRWLTWEIGQRYRRALDAMFDRLAASEEDGTVWMPHFQKAFMDSEPSLTEKRGAPAVVLEVQAELRRSWAELLPIPEGARRLSFDAEALRQGVQRAFAAPRPGWESARYISPDLMIAARDVDAIRRGDAVLVLGEVHISNTLLPSFFVWTHPAEEELFALWEHDNPAPSVMPVLPKEEWPQRVNQALVASYDLRYSFSRDPSPAPPERTLRIGDLFVARRDGALEVRHRDRDLRIDLLEFMGVLLSSMVANALDPIPERDHTPRVRIDDVVVAREKWRFQAGALPFARIRDPIQRWIELRRFQRRHGLPRFVFVKAPVEVKPCFLDLDSSVYVDMLSKLIRRSAEADPSAVITVTEMLPTFDELWLHDAAGERYTSELRLVAFDTAGRPRGGHLSRQRNGGDE